MFYWFVCELGCFVVLDLRGFGFAFLCCAFNVFVKLCEDDLLLGCVKLWVCIYVDLW